MSINYSNSSRKSSKKDKEDDIRVLSEKDILRIFDNKGKKNK